MYWYSPGKDAIKGEVYKNILCDNLVAESPLMDFLPLMKATWFVSIITVGVCFFAWAGTAVFHTK